MENKLRQIIREELNQINLSENVTKVGNVIAPSLKKYLETVQSKSKGYVNNERDAAILLYDILKHRYNIG